jgi:alkylation response protein AidB-like acyl-CoA dehydrogenase
MQGAIDVADDIEASNEELRTQVREWLAAHWDPRLSVDDWWQIVGRAGWTAPHFTREHGGRGLHRTAGNIVRATFAEFGALRPPGGLGLLMAAPTIGTHGTPEQVTRLIPPVLEGRVNWCQFFSEPGAGSDLAGLTTRAERDGDRWIVNGQKVWSSMARDCDYGMLLARTDFSVPKHKGISWFAIRLDQPGVTVRPLREMTGEAVFNEVFFDDAECDADDLIGGEGNGWAVTQTTLFFERTGIGAGGSHAGFPVPGPKGGMLGRRAGDAALDPMPGGNLILQFADLVALARRRGRAADPLIRQKLARLYGYSKLGQWNAQRAKAEAKKGGGQAVANLGKIAQTRIVKSSAALGAEILGADATLAAPDGDEHGRYTDALVFSPASSIYGGTDEIQRNIIAERTLGLPREELPGKGEPYGEVLRAIARRD